MSCAFRISEAASLAIHAAGLIAGAPEKPMSVKTIAAALDASEPHLSKVLHRLARLGYLSSTRGRGGGFELARKADEVSLMEIFEAVEGPLVLDSCLLSSNLCDGSSCALGSVLQEINKMLFENLSNTTLAAVGAGLRDGLTRAGRIPT
jgi:Rrf2 family protein